MSSFAFWPNDQYDHIAKDNVTDTEVDSWFLMGRLTPVALIIIVYLAFVLKIGPHIMENRKPFVLKEVLLFYNLTMTLFNAYLFTMLLPALSYPVQYLCIPHPNKHSLNFTKVTSVWKLRHTSSWILLFPSMVLFCPLNSCIISGKNKMAIGKIKIQNGTYEGFWYFAMSKIIELLDTVFFVLRKKQSQISTLHVFHHTNMVLNTWMYLKYMRNEQLGILVVIINSFVHIIMYSYYFLAALGPNVQKYLWWKKYITVLQMVQFVIIFVYLTMLLLMNCEIHRGTSVYMATHTIIFMVMFSNFYYKSYSLGKSTPNFENSKQKVKSQ